LLRYNFSLGLLNFGLGSGEVLGDNPVFRNGVVSWSVGGQISYCNCCLRSILHCHCNFDTVTVSLSLVSSVRIHIDIKFHCTIHIDILLFNIDDLLMLIY
jgi:hypothetical protein